MELLCLVRFAESAQAARADMHLPVHPVDVQICALDVRPEAAVGDVRRVADVVPKLDVLATDITSTRTGQFLRPPLLFLLFAVSLCRYCAGRRPAGVELRALAEGGSETR